MDRTHSVVPILSAVGKDSPALRASRSSLEDNRVGKVSHSVTYSMSLRKCLVVKEGQEREASKFKLKDKM